MVKNQPTEEQNILDFKKYLLKSGNANGSTYVSDIKAFSQKEPLASFLKGRAFFGLDSESAEAATVAFLEGPDGQSFSASQFRKYLAFLSNTRGYEIQNQICLPEREVSKLYYYVLWSHSLSHDFSFENFNEGDVVTFEKKDKNGKSRKVKSCFDCAKPGDFVLDYSTDSRKIFSLAKVIPSDEGSVTIKCLKRFASPVSKEQMESSALFKKEIKMKEYFSNHLFSKNFGRGITMDRIKKDTFWRIVEMGGINPSDYFAEALLNYQSPISFLKTYGGTRYHADGGQKDVAKAGGIAKSAFCELANRVVGSLDPGQGQTLKGEITKGWQNSGFILVYFWDYMRFMSFPDEPIGLSITANSAGESYSCEIQTLDKVVPDQPKRTKELIAKLLSFPIPDGFRYFGKFVVSQDPKEILKVVQDIPDSQLSNFGLRISAKITDILGPIDSTDIASANEGIYRRLLSWTQQLLPLYRHLFFEDESVIETHSKAAVDPLYNKKDFLDEVFVDESFYDDAITLLHEKKNILLYGAPGVGKTFLAKRLAYADMGSKKASHVACLQFHQSYSYEDFVEGFRPNSTEGFHLVHGLFWEFAEKARHNPTESYYLIIDEINRGNVSKIFGELLLLIEGDKRSQEYGVDLAYGNYDAGMHPTEEKFYVPANLYLIGMMNSADRSLTRMDYALRRRFSFIDVHPAFSNDHFNEKVHGYARGNPEAIAEIDDVIGDMRTLNAEISKDTTLGEDFQIGHSYFLPQEGVDASTPESAKTWLKRVIKYDILPLLREYMIAGDLEEGVKAAKEKLESYLSK